MLPGDEVLIDSYVSRSHELEHVRGPWSGWRTRDGQPGCRRFGHKVDDVQAADLNRATAEASFDLLKNWLSKNEPSIGSDGVKNQLDDCWQSARYKRPPRQRCRPNGDRQAGARSGVHRRTCAGHVFQSGREAWPDRTSIALKEGDTSFSYVIPEQYGTCEFHIEYASKATDWQDDTGPARSNELGTRPGGVEHRFSDGSALGGAQPRKESRSWSKAAYTARWQLRVFRG